MTDKKMLKGITWDLSYKRLAIALGAFYVKNQNNSALSLYNLVFKKSQLIRNQNWFKNISTYSEQGIDPIQVFTSFSSYKSRSEFRTEIINEWFRILEVQEIHQNINFTGCPAPFAIKILAGRPLDQQIQIWRAFSEIFSKGEKALQKILLVKIKEWKGINFVSFSIFLFWIDAEKFISLDKNTTSFLLKTFKDFVTPSNFSQYIDFIEKIPEGLNKAIVAIAYDPESMKSLTPTERNKLEQFIGNKPIKSLNEREITAAVDFRLIGLRIYDTLREEYRKTLNPGTFTFYEAYTIKDDIIEIDKNKLIDIYSDKGLRISLSAIVGKNGSGKSAVSELIFMAINNIYWYYLSEIKRKDVSWIKDLEFELFFESYGIYQLVFRDNTVKIFEFNHVQKKTYKKSEELTVDKTFLLRFFYTISVNYSLYGLNSRHNRDWLEKLFVKNDGYENPVVFEPNREKGNIDIHRQEELLRTRFLSNVVELVRDEMNEGNTSGIPTDSFRYIREGIEFKSATLSLNQAKVLAILIRRNKSIVTKRGIKLNTILGCIQKEYRLKKVALGKIDFSNVKIPQSIALRYLIKKIYKITRTYSPYKEQFWDRQKEEITDIAKLIKKLSEDETHVTYKIRQTLNYLEGKISYIEKEYGLDELVKLVNGSIRDHKNFKGNELEVIELLPPPFMNIELSIVDNKKGKKPYPFEQLSSGERQQIYSLNSILYHLKNLDSVKSEDRIQYRCVNLILDEVELYAHPEMQRAYINELLKLIEKTSWSSLVSMNVLFITHSPFILSDIPAERIMFLNQEGFQEKRIDTKTFGANIHELLISGFFLSNTLGELALTKINSIIAFHNKVMSANKAEREILLGEYAKNEKLFKYIVTELGEEYISGILNNHLVDIEKILYKNQFVQKRIQDLEKEIEELKNSKIK